MRLPHTALLAAYAGEAKLTAVRHLNAGIYRAYPLDGTPRWRAWFCLEREGLAPGKTASVPISCRETGLPEAGLYPGMVFELRDNGAAIARGQVLRCWNGCIRTLGMERLTVNGFRTRAVSALVRVFRPRGAWQNGLAMHAIDAPFQLAISQRGLFACHPSYYDQFPPYFETRHCRAFVTAARVVGDRGLYLYIDGTFTEASDLEYYPAVYFPLETEAQIDDFVSFYDANIVPLGHVLFSPSGQWGAITESDGYALAGGSPSFMARVYAELGTTESEEVRCFLDQGYASIWLDAQRAGKAAAPYDWVPDLLSHLYGAQRAAQFIRDAGERRKS